MTVGHVAYGAGGQLLVGSGLVETLITGAHYGTTTLAGVWELNRNGQILNGQATAGQYVAQGASADITIYGVAATARRFVSGAYSDPMQAVTFASLFVASPSGFAGPIQGGNPGDGGAHRPELGCKITTNA